MTKDLDKLIRAFGFVTSSNREGAFKSLIEYVLYNLEDDQDNESICEFINMEFGIDFNVIELQDASSQLIRESSLVRTKEKKFNISETRRKEISEYLRSVQLGRDSRQNRLMNFLKSIDENNSGDVILSEVLSKFTNYLYECFYEYGRKAVSIIAEESFTKDIRNKRQLLMPILNGLKGHGKTLFLQLVERFTEVMTSDDLDYLESLAHKAEMFLSLGLEQEQYEAANDLNFIDWVVFVDTNFLYSILKLHKHDEDDASNQILNIVKDNDLKVRFTFLPDTQKELQSKRRDFDKSISRVNYTKNQLSALLKSGNLDSFSKRYFELKIVDPDNTPHPTEIIDHHIEILKRKGISVYQSNFKRLREDDAYNGILDEISKFKEFEKYRNEIRQEKGLDFKNPKDDNLIEHDVFLREAILSLRDIRATSLNEIRYFGLTLDKSLLGYDGHRLRQDRMIKIPVFFLPSFLLGKLLRFTPLATDDYKKAFITALSSTVFDDSSSKWSNAVQQSAQKFFNMGIDDEQVILSCLADRVFLESYSKLESEDDRALFVESELGKHQKDLSEKIDKLEQEVSMKQDLISGSSLINREKQKEIEELKNKVSVLASDNELFKNELGKLSRRYEEKLVTSGGTQFQFEISNENKSRSDIYETAQIPHVEGQEPALLSINWGVLYKNGLWYIGALNIIALVIVIILALSASQTNILLWLSAPPTLIGLFFLLMPDARSKKVVFWLLTGLLFWTFLVLISTWESIASFP